MKTIWLLLIQVGLIHTLCAQSNTPIEIRRAKGTFGYFQGEQRLNYRELGQVLSVHPMAAQDFALSKQYKWSGIGFAGIGAAVLLYGLSPALNGQQSPNWLAVGAGAGIAAVSIPLIRRSNQHLKWAIESFNLPTASTSFWDKKSIDWVISSHGVGFRMRF